MNERFLFLNPELLVSMPQVRREFGPGAYADLLDSIRAVGILQPIQARQVGDELHIVCGHRRAKAALEVGLLEVPVLLSDIQDSEVASIQLIENLIRENLTLRDAAMGVREVFETTAGGSSAVVCELLGKSKGWVSKMLLTTNPSRSNSVARRLLRQDRLNDLEQAYLLCQIEAIDLLRADAIGDEIESYTRALLTKELKHARTRAKMSGTETNRRAEVCSVNIPGADGPEDGEAPEDWGDDKEFASHVADAAVSTLEVSGISLFFPGLSLDVLMFLRRAAVDAVVTAHDRNTKMLALEAIDKQLWAIKE